MYLPARSALMTSSRADRIGMVRLEEEDEEYGMNSDSDYPAMKEEPRNSEDTVELDDLKK